MVQTEREEIEVSRVISALPANSLANVVSASHPNLTTMLNSIEQVTVGLVNLEWTGQRITDEAFGFLVPSTQNLPVLGVVYDTCAFPQGDRTVVTCMMGGKWYKSLFGDHTTKEDLLAVARKNIEMILGISDAPDRYQVRNFLFSRFCLDLLFHFRFIWLGNEERLIMKNTHIFIPLLFVCRLTYWKNVFRSTWWAIPAR